MKTVLIFEYSGVLPHWILDVKSHLNKLYKIFYI